MATSMKAEELKAQGNKCFQNGDFVGAEKFYTQAIIKDSTNAAFFTNRALARLKLEAWEDVIADCHKALDILPTSLKAYTYLGQANLHLDRPNEALSSSLQAYKLAIEQRSPSAATIAASVLTAKKRRWEVLEQRRIEQEGELLPEIIKLLWEGCEREIEELRKQRKIHNEGFNRADSYNSNSSCGNSSQGRMHTIQELHEQILLQRQGTTSGRSAEYGGGLHIDREMGREQKASEDTTDPDWASFFKEECDSTRSTTQEKIKAIQEVFAKVDATRYKPRIVPDYFIDNITFSFMLDPVVTKHGQSYERATILEHLRRSKTDPLTREPLTEDDLRPNLALKQACEEFLKENGWAVDY